MVIECKRGGKCQRMVYVGPSCRSDKHPRSDIQESLVSDLYYEYGERVKFLREINHNRNTIF